MGKNGTAREMGLTPAGFPIVFAKFWGLRSAEGSGPQEGISFPQSDRSRSQHGETARVDEIACIVKQDAGRDQDILDRAVLMA
jgi:hypothetical protein